MELFNFSKTEEREIRELYLLYASSPLAKTRTHEETAIEAMKHLRSYTRTSSEKTIKKLIEQTTKLKEQINKLTQQIKTLKQN